ncbi:hypothetical protein Y032_0278g1153 [Ancylostoma ceylanicum]|uniref:Uncharacterized protein n=1 Tax=Ancylostoma ceylanicum TaxID=53326 RepID=A0A016S749_9BILA|nr:hypothetical protein Y032_0278g1153 [Ancylostoma ceylanicum]
MSSEIVRLPLYSSRSIAVSVAAPRRHWPLCVLIVGGASLAWVAAVAAVVDNGDRPSPLSSTPATDRRRCRRQRRPTVAAVVDNGDRPSPLSSTTATDRRRCRRQRRPTVAAVVDNGDRPSPLSSTTATDRRRCRRQRRPTVPTVAAVVDTPSSIPIDDSGDDRRDKRKFCILKLFSMLLFSCFVLVNEFVRSATV